MRRWSEISGIPGKDWKSKAWVIRLTYQGCRNRPFFHIVAAPKSRPRNWDCEQIGSFDPLKNEAGQKLVAVNMDRIKYWVSNGAEVSNPVLKLLGLAGALPVNPATYAKAMENREKIANGEPTTWSSDNLPKWRTAKKVKSDK